MRRHATVPATLLLLALTGGCATTPCESPEPPRPLMGEAVVLVHGMGRSRASMWVLQSRLADAGYETFNFPYCTATDSLDEISAQLIQFIGKEVGLRPYHLIGHSLGNIIIRNGFKQEYPRGLKRIVMITPPNKPARLAKRFKDVFLYEWFTGDSGQKLADAAFYETLPIPPVEFGVIAGDNGRSWLFEEPNDGIIVVEATRLEGMSDWVCMPEAHTFLMSTQASFANCLHFLASGRFAHPAADRPSGSS